MKNLFSKFTLVIPVTNTFLSIPCVQLLKIVRFRYLCAIWICRGLKELVMFCLGQSDRARF